MADHEPNEHDDASEASAAETGTGPAGADAAPTVEDCRRYLRAHFIGDLRFDDHVRGVRFVFAPDGRMVVPVMVAMLGTPDTVLFVPEVAEGAMEVQVTLEPFEEKGDVAALCDRWRIHHGEPQDVRWAMLVPDAAKWHGVVVDGEALLMPHPWPDDEARVLKPVNDRVRAARDAGDDVLQAAVERHEGVRLEAPMVVGIDDRGLDVRGKFDVKRLDFEEAVDGPDAARAEALRALGLEPAGSTTA